MYDENNILRSARGSVHRTQKPRLLNECMNEWMTKFGFQYQFVFFFHFDELIRNIVPLPQFNGRISGCINTNLGGLYKMLGQSLINSILSHNIIQ